MRRRLIVVISLLVITAAITGCDSHKAERTSLSKQAEDVEAEISRSNDRLVALTKETESLSTEVTQSTDRLQQHEQRLTSLQDELAEYLLNHKMATVALMATAGGAATIISESIDEDTKSALQIVGVIGAVTSTIAASKLALQKRQEEQTSLRNFITKKTGERDALRKEHDKLVCSLCF